METNSSKPRIIKYNFDEFYKYCKMYFDVYGDLDIGSKCMVIDVDGVPTILKRPMPDEIAHKIYDLGAKMILVREALESGTGRSPPQRLNGATITQEQAGLLDNIDIGWRVKGQSTFLRLYKYCVEYKKVCGDLSIAHQCVAVKNPDGSYSFMDKRKVPDDRLQDIEYTLGAHFWKYVELARKDEMINRKRTITPEQCKLLEELDPYWAYPRNKFGERLDPVTNQKVDMISTQSGVIDPNTKIRRCVGFDFDEFYGFALLYHAKYGELDIGSEVVAVRLSDRRIDFFDRTAASRAGLKICYQIGKRMKSIRASYVEDRDAEVISAMTTAQKIYVLSDDQYEMLDELDPRWRTNTIAKHDLDKMHMTRKVRYPRTQAKKEKFVSEDTEETSKDVPDEVDPLVAYEKKVAKLYEVKHFDFELFYKVCMHHVDVVGSLILSKVQSITYTNDDGIKDEYPLGPVWYVLASTKLFELNNPMFGEVREPKTKISLTDEQNERMEEIDSLWFLRASQRRSIRATMGDETNSSRKNKKIIAKTQ